MTLHARSQWPESYRRGSHCFSTMISNVFDDTGWELSEELAYVLGGGLGLLFYRDDETCYVNSRLHDLEHFFARRTGSRIDFASHPTAESMLTTARDWVDAGRLPFLYCEARELSAFRGVLPWESVHPFGEHALPVRSVESATLVCNDYLWSKSREVSFAEIERAASMPSDGAVSMASPARRFAVGCIVPPVAKPDLEVVLPAALAETAEIFLAPANNTQGERALKTMERDIASLPDLLSAPALRRELVSMATMLEKIGSGGGAGRHLFSRGVAEAASVLGVPAMEVVAAEYAALGGQWRSLCRRMQRHAAAVDVREGWADLILAIRGIRSHEVATAERLIQEADAVIGAGG